MASRKPSPGLVQRFGSLNVVNDNAGCFGSRPLPRNGCLIDFGALTVYIATESLAGFPKGCRWERIHPQSAQFVAGVPLAPLAAWRS